ncbi:MULTISPECIES: hypothetical protein [unclassified Pseudomonas]|uniref:hypothetical protein n=1 Tax=unclassified Pseudomonas TaxID=196821 RepID=UPI002447F4F9|nr:MULTISPECIES: hypothetical protein [unclassified Pseudomonas]MDH0895916.1 hypothetical protein [Pseudomonas sp. GD03875]MDH1067177.1 hypothetical protein [Pseudomonas sp. GD03985]
MLITLDEYKKFLKSTFFRDCSVRDKNIFVFITEPDLTDEQIEEEEANGYDPSLRLKQVATFFKDQAVGTQWGWSPLVGWESTITGAAQKPLNQSINGEQFAVFPSMESRVFVTGSGPAYQDKSLTASKGDFLRGALLRLKTINGWLYACGGGRSFAKRLDKGTWQSFSEAIPTLENEGENGIYSGFRDFDGFNEQDIYAAGGNGDVWHFDGNRWTPIAFPTNEPLQSVCCGGDGNVYISGYEGLTFMGRGERWKQIHRGGISLGFRDMVWYEDRVWCTSDYGVWTIHNGRVERAKLPDDIGSCAGHLYTGDGVLLLAGLGGAAFKENGQWHSIVSFPVMERLLELDQASSAP